MSLEAGPQTSRGPLVWSIKLTLILSLAATGIAHSIARLVATKADSAYRSARLLDDPEVTGSIGETARTTWLGPCILRAGARDIRNDD